MVIGLVALAQPAVGFFATAPRATLAPPLVQARPAIATDRPALSQPVVATTAPVATDSTTVAPVSEQTYTGTLVDTRYGPFQVAATLRDGRIIDVQTLAQPGDGRSRQINDRALPSYAASAVATQSANLDHVSGATYTWHAYEESLQAALDQA